MRLLVTGGAGYIGGFATRQLLASGHEVIVVDDLSSGEAAAAAGSTLLQEDFGDRAAMRAALARFRVEAVFHFAGLKSVSESFLEPARYQRVNVGGTIELVQAMIEADVPMLVYSSSCAIYGDVAPGPVSESAQAAPMNPYAASKWEAEQAIARMASTGSLRYVALRYFNAAGASTDGQFGERLSEASNLFPIVMQAALGLRDHVVVNGIDYPTPDGSALRDYVHVLDLAEAHERALEYLASGAESVVLNLGTGQPSSVLDVVACVESVSGRPIGTIAGPRREGDPAAVWADGSKAARTLGWTPCRGLRDIAASAWMWHSRAANAA